MIKVYKIKVADKVYEVEVEAITEKEGKIASSAPVAVVPAPVTSGEGTKIEAPMQGKIFDIVVSVGAKVKAGDTLIVIEAMKMENAIVAPCDGTVTSISINKGDTVDGGDTLATIA